MGTANRLVRTMSYVLIGIGALLLVLSFFFARVVDLALPLVFLMLGGSFYLLTSFLQRRWEWAAFLFVPGSVLLALGVIFLFNTITNDWNAWAYAWLLIVSGIGLGLVLANQEGQWRREWSLAGWGMIMFGLTFFAVFGAIAGGPFIRFMAPVLLVLGGLSLRWLRPEAVLSERMSMWLDSHHILVRSALPIAEQHLDKGSLPEPLSARELEVLRLIDLGLSNPEIADKLVLASSTVKTHINNIYGKLAVQSRTQAIKRAREIGLLT